MQQLNLIICELNIVILAKFIDRLGVRYFQLLKKNNIFKLFLNSKKSIVDIVIIALKDSIIIVHG